MWRDNETRMTGFILVGLFPEFQHRSFLVSVVLLVYLAAFTANAVLILLIWVDSRLHIPMYFLLSQLSLLDLALTSTTTPKIASDFFSGKRTISCVACGIQMFLYLTIGIAECLLLTLMSYDRYAAVCHPLRYPVLVSPGVCLQMVSGSWIGGTLSSLVLTVYAATLPVCGSREIHQYFCELPSVVKLACEDTSAFEMAVLVSGVGFLLVPVSLIVASYALIFLSVLRMDSREGRRKALTTCSSHLTVVTLYFGPGIFIYMTPGPSHAPDQNQGVSLFGTLLTPALNPLIYSLRNREVSGALTKVLGKCVVLRWGKKNFRQ
ncbi:olfactory receptor 2AG2-like [Tachyglossus aculeatus]|uniref:olfactory receptor 2AG2-like n=1 Tax=Tachyglossus aculeatus TaxID=9261 RepID=UPI0018F55054|nr:olfactory receptor 2AG2-like [Tachyglossus aculeatus]